MIVASEYFAEFIIDSLLIVVTCGILMRRFSYAGLVLLANYILLHILVYFVLMQFSFWEIFIVDFHLYLAMLGLIVFSALCLVSKSHNVLKFFIALEIALHLILLFWESVDWIYNNYTNARILLVSFQIIGLVTNVDGDNRGGRSIYSRWRAISNYIIDHRSKRITSIL
jgi:hypothetical protein